MFSIILSEYILIKKIIKDDQVDTYFVIMFSCCECC